MFALYRFMRLRPFEQGKPQASSAIDATGPWHRENPHGRRGCSMFSMALLVLVVTGMLWCIAAVAQESPAKGKMSKEREFASIRALEKPPKKADRVESSLQRNGVSIEIQTEDIMQPLVENRSKVTLFSGMNGKIQVELGLFGYLGLKYKF